MGKKGRIAHYRETLDKTLASNNLTDGRKLRSLVKDQILRSSVGKTRDYIDNVLEKRTGEVSTFLEMLRSASNEHGAPDNTHQASWKLKQDTEEFRVMYREGPVGSPLHSLLVEGYIDAPVDVCLCVSWETALYPRWFPDMLIPTFKVVEAKSLQKVMIGEEISLVRVKLSWPMSSREAILHCFAFEYMEDGLVIVLMNTIPDIDDIQLETHGFTNEGIPEVQNTVRIGLVGGFALQKVTESRSYFRTIGNMDIKLDFVPPSLINFISRQVIGSGFRFYQKTVASVSKGDKAFAKVLSGPLYCRIREALSSNTEAKNLEPQNINNCTIISNGKQMDDLPVAEISKNECGPSNEIQEEEKLETNTKKHGKLLGDMFKAGNEIVLSNGNINGYTEIEEEIGGNSEIMAKNNNVNFSKSDCNSTDQLQLVDPHKNVPISPQVEKALGTLDKMINAVREGRLKGHDSDKPLSQIEPGEVTLSSALKNMDLPYKQGVSTQQNVGTTTHVSTVSTVPDDLRFTNQDFHLQEAKPGVTLTLPIQNPPIGSWSRNAVSAGNSPVVDSSVNLSIDNIDENTKKNGHPRKWRFCCLHIVSGRLVS